MLMWEISAVLDLISVELATLAEMSETLGVFTCDNLGVPLGVAEVLPRRECSTHGSAYQQ